MKILNINLHFYPESIGGATVVAEKLAWGLQGAGHDVTNVFLSLPPGNQDFRAIDTPFGSSIGIKNIPRTPANRFYNPAATSVLREIVDIVRPERIFVHATQNMGMHELLDDPALLDRTVVIAHDFYWACLQGFRNLPDGSPCGLRPGKDACRQCAWYPGLTERIYDSSRAILTGCRAVVFPSHYLHGEYVRLLGAPSPNFLVQPNPDKAETIIPDPSVLPMPSGRDQKQAGKTVFGFVGGPGETKGWGLVQKVMQRARDMADLPHGPHVVLFDIGRSANAPWYPGMERPGTTIADPFHWSFAGHALGQLDVMLMPSRVRESFGLAAREMLSLGKTSVIRPSGALAEIADHDGVVVAGDEDDVDAVLDGLEDARSGRLPEWPTTSIEDYARKLMSL